MPPKRRIAATTAKAARSKQQDLRYQDEHPRTRTPGPERRRPKQLDTQVGEQPAAERKRARPNSKARKRWRAAQQLQQQDGEVGEADARAAAPSAERTAPAQLQQQDDEVGEADARAAAPSAERTAPAVRAGAQSTPRRPVAGLIQDVATVAKRRALREVHSVNRRDEEQQEGKRSRLQQVASAEENACAAGGGGTLRQVTKIAGVKTVHEAVQHELQRMQHEAEVPPSGRCWVASMIAQTDPDVPRNCLDKEAQRAWAPCQLTGIPGSPQEHARIAAHVGARSARIMLIRYCCFKLKFLL